MKRTEITEIFPEATAEQVEAIMALHGKGIADVNQLNEQLTVANTELDTLRARPDQTEALNTAQSTIQQLQAELDTMKAADTLRQTREKVAAAKGIPVGLLTGETEEACAAQADAILAFAKPDGLSIRDGGEPAAKGGPSTRDQFANWAKENF